MKKRKRLLWRLFPSYLLITLISLLAVSWYASEAMRLFFLDQTATDLKARAALLEKQIHPRIIELNPKSVRKAKDMGLLVYLGDSTHSEVLLHAGIRKAAAAVVTVPDPLTCRGIIRNIRLTAPGTAVIVRGRYHIAINQLEEAGASSVIDEENVVGHRMAQNVLDFLFTAIPYSMACGLAGKQSDIPEDSPD